MRVAVGGGVAWVPHRQHAHTQQGHQQGEGDEAVTLGGDVLLAAVLRQQLHDDVRQPLHLSSHLHTNIFTISKSKNNVPLHIYTTYEYFSGERHDIQYFLLYLWLQDGVVVAHGDHHVAVRPELTEVGEGKSLGQGLLHAALADHGRQQAACVTHVFNLNNDQDIILLALD